MTYCERCGGELGNGCAGTGTADCDLNLELAADGVSPDHYRNRAPAAPAAPVCVKCGHPVMRSWGGWGHAPGRTDRRRHVVVVAADVTPS